MLIPELGDKSYALNFVDAASAYHHFLANWISGEDLTTEILLSSL